MPRTPPTALQHDLLGDDRLGHGFFTRHGGVSGGVYGSLNGGVGSGDEPGKVERNRAIAAEALGGAGSDIRGLHQVHSATAIEAGDAARQEGDALVSDKSGHILTVLTADCAPVLLADVGAGVVAAAHAGWRGAVEGIIPATINAMLRLKADPARIKAVVGPSIQQASYQVGQEVRDAALAASPDMEDCFAPDPDPGRFRFDLPRYVLGQLLSAGVEAVAMDEDTYTDNRFFSHRRTCHGDASDCGRQMSMIRLQP